MSILTLFVCIFIEYSYIVWLRFHYNLKLNSCLYDNKDLCFPSPCIARTNRGQSEIKHVLAPKLLSPCYKELVHAFSCAYIELWMHLGSLESTQEARVALGFCLEQLLRFFRALQTSRVHPQLDIRTLSMNQMNSYLNLFHTTVFVLIASP